jgi:hypothetical protein
VSTALLRDITRRRVVIVYRVYCVELYRRSVKWMVRNKRKASRLCFKLHATVLLVNLFTVMSWTFGGLRYVASVCLFHAFKFTVLQSGRDCLTMFEESRGNGFLWLADTRHVQETRNTLRVELMLVKLKVRPECFRPSADRLQCRG